MAILFPDLGTIKVRKVKPTDGEAKLLQFLVDNLDDDFEVYYQPFINGMIPDIVIMRKAAGVMLIEVKDWHLKNYYLDEKRNWRLKENNTLLKSPLSQVFSYKEDIYNLHIEHLLEKTIKNPKLFAFVNCAVYFHNETSGDLKAFLTNGFLDNKKYIKYLGYFELMGYDSLNKTIMKQLVERRRLNRYNRLFDDALYKSISNFLKPSLHTVEEGKQITYTKKQSELILSEPGLKKIKGVVGSGKTFILAKRAVEAHKRTSEKILILTYNITLRNYIHDRISEVRDNFCWGNFYIDNYHNFIVTQFNNLGIRMEVPENIPIQDRSSYLELNYFSNVSLFDNMNDKCLKFPAIFIDEVQDYKTEWIRIVSNHFLEPGGEFVVYGDEKQNIYDRTLDIERKPKTGIPGRWNELNQSFRLTNDLAALAIQFQTYYFQNKYITDEIQIIPQQNLFNYPTGVKYYYFEKNLGIDWLGKNVISIIEEMKLSPNDICFLGSRINLLRELDYFIRMKTKQKTTTMFETKEIWDHLDNEYKRKFENSEVRKEKFECALEGIRKNKKFNYWMNTGLMKLCTIHSFKGWEIPTLILLLERDEDVSEIFIDELIYTGFTRCRYNLIILNIGIFRYDSFFKKNIENCYTLQDTYY